MIYNYPGVGGGGYLVYSDNEMCTPSRVSFSPLFSNAGYQKKAIFLEPVVRKSILFGYCVIFPCNIYVLEHTFRRFV